MSDLAERVSERRQELGLSQSELARRIGIRPQSIQQLEQGSIAKPRYLLELAHALGVAPEWLAGEARLPARPVPATEEEFALIPAYDLTASAGGGSVFQAENVKYRLAFRRPWLNSVTAAPETLLSVLEAAGDSMEDTVRHGDTLLVDRSQTNPRADAIFVLRWEDQLLVKRVQADPARRMVTLISDNPRYPRIADIRPDDLDVLGRVIWIGRRV